MLFVEQRTAYTVQQHKECRKSHSGHAPSLPEQIIEVGHLSSNFKITCIIQRQQGADFGGRFHR